MKYYFFAFVLIVLSACSDQGTIKNDRLVVDNASIAINQKEAVIETGRVRRILEFTPKGLRTVEFKTENNEFTPLISNQYEDWDIPSAGMENPILTSATIEKNKNLGSNKPYIDLTIDYEYPKANIGVRYVISAIPNAPGTKSQIFLKKLNADASCSFDKINFEHISLRENDSIQAVGYFQNLSLTETSKEAILREEKLTSESSKWANLIYAEYPEGGMVMVKESPQTVDQQKFKLGNLSQDEKGAVFIASENISANNLGDTYRPLWATWSILYQGTDIEREYAIKLFDRLRYPINKQRDIYIASDLEGSYPRNQKKARYQMREANFGAELKSARSIGVNLVHIGKGWQRKKDSIYYPVHTVKYSGFSEVGEKIDSYVAYNDHWRKVKKDADRYSMRTALWTPQEIPLDSLIWNQQKGNFRWYRVQNNPETTLDSLLSQRKKFTDFIDRQGDYYAINYDLERNSANVGYFFARVNGNIRLQSLAQDLATKTGGNSWMLLRNLWHLSKYTNLNQYQIPFHSAMLNREINPNNQRKLFYPLTISLLGTPLFYQEIQGANTKTIKKVREYLEEYKKYRVDLYKGIILPIANEPSNKSWTGFQNYYLNSRRGYLYLFREQNNNAKKQTIAIHGVTEGRVKLTNILTGTSEMVKANAKGEIEFEIKNPGDFRFFRYERIDM